MESLWNLAVLFLVALFASNVSASPVENMLPPWNARGPTTTSSATFATLTVSPQTPGANCTTTLLEGGKFGPLKQATCTFYDSYTTITEYVDCGGCALETLGLGPGPVVRCGTNTKAPLGTETVTTCSSSAATGPTAPAMPTATATYAGR